MEKVAFGHQTLMYGEGNDGRDQTDARYHLDALPQNWLSDPKSPAQRHSGMGNYLFVDGHVKSYSPQAVTVGNWFAVKASKP